MKRFLQKNYCELLYNVFTSDYVRNADKQKMQTYFRDEGISAQYKDELVAFIRNELKVGYVKHTFSYEFKTKTNNELYQIIFFTPNLKGLEKLKEALWDTFKGKEFHRNKNESKVLQLSFFTPEQDAEMYVEYYAMDANQLIYKAFRGQEKNYKDIELYVIENTLLKESHIIKHVIKPLIENNKIKKLDTIRKSNYKQDKYQFLG